MNVERPFTRPGITFTKLPLVLLLASALLGGAATAVAATKTWSPTAGGSWTTAGNWSPNGAPAAGDAVIINSDQSGNITGVPTITLSDLTVSGNCLLEPASSGSSFNTITVTNSFSMAAGKTFTMGDSGHSFVFTLSATGTVNGNFAYDAGSQERDFTVNGTLIINPGGRLYDPKLSGGSYFILSSGATLKIGNAGGISTGNASDATVAVNFGGSYTYGTGANYFYIGNTNQVTGNGLPATVSSLTINNTGAAGTNVVTLTANVTVSGDLSVSAGSFDLTTHTANRGSAGGTFALADGTTLLLGTNNFPTTYGTFSLGAASTVNYDNTGAQNVAAQTYGNLIFSGSGAKSMVAATSVGGNLTVAPTGSATASVGAGLNLPVNTLTLGATGTAGGTWGSTTATSAANHNNTYFSATTGYLTVSTDTRFVPTISALPTATAITYGQTLASSSLSGGSASVSGSFNFTTPSTAPNAGTYSASVTFTPVDILHYSPVVTNVNVTVNQASPNVTAYPTASAISYGQTLAASVLSGGSATPAGTFAFTTPSTAPDVGTAAQGVTYTPADTANYSTASGTVSVTVIKANPNVSAYPTASAITFGQTLANSTLSGGSATPAGSFAFTTPSTAPNAGTAAQGVTYSPTDSFHYNTASSTVSVTVNKANPNVTAYPTASAITYGQTLANSILSGGSATPAGSFAFTTPSTAPNAGTASQSVTYSPTDSANYNTASSTVSVTVNKADPNVTAYPTASAITYGQTLANSILTGGSATPAGSFAFTTPSTAPSAGTASQSVTYSPTDSANYNTANSTVSVTVNKANPNVTAYPTASAITYGQTLANSTLSGGSATPAGSFAFTTPSTAPSAGTASQSVTYSPTDSANYNTASSTVSVTVNKADPNVTAYPTASAITYGQTLANSILTGGSATPAGSFAFTTPSTAPSAGTASQSVTYSPTDSANYNTASSTVSVTVNKADPNVTAYPTASAITYGQTLANSTLSGGSATPAGSFAFTTPSTAPSAGTASQSVTYSPTDSANYNTASSTVSVTVNKADPNVTAYPTASAITYGQTLANSTLSGGSATPAGSFAFTTPSTAPNAGTAAQSVTYSPTDSANYNTASSTVSVTVNKADPNVTAYPTASAITYGQTLANSILTGGSATPAGSFAFTTPSTAPSAGTASQSVTYSPTDSANYNTASSTVSVNVSTKMLTVTGITAGNKAYDGNTTATLNTSAAALVGKLPADAVTLDTTGATGAFTDPDVGTDKTVLVSGLTLGGGDLANYSLTQPTATATITMAGLTVTGVQSLNKVYDGTNSATLIVSNAVLVGIVDGDTVTLDPTNAAGAFADKIVGTGKLVQVSGLALLGTDAAKYTLTQPTTNADITPAGLTVTGVTASDKIYDGNPTATLDTTSAALSGKVSGDDVTLDASSAAGAFADSNVGAGKPVQVSGLSVSGADVGNYTLTQPTLSASITQASPSVSVWPTASPITYSQTLGDSILSGGSATPVGTFAFTTPSTAPGAGTTSYSVTFTPADTANYSTASTTVSVTVNKADASVSAWPTASAITYGQTLADSILSGGSATPAGTFAFTTPSTAPGAGMTSYSVTFTPADTANYSTASTTVSVTVNKADSSVTAYPTASAITYGQTLANSILTGGSATPAGTFAFTTPSTAPNAGTASQSVTYSPTDSANYNTASSTVSVTVNKANPNVTAYPTAGAITYGQTLANSTLSGGSATPAGSFAFTTPSTAPGAGTAAQSVTYSPTDSANYNTASSTVSVTVNKANPNVTAYPTAGAITYGQTLADSTLSGGSATPAGSFAFTTPSTAPSAGTASQSVTYSPTDSANYNTASSTVSVTVNKANPNVTAYPTASAITYGQTLADSILSGGSATPAGTFAFSLPSTAPGVGTASYSVIFTPTDAANYSTASSTVSVTVNKADPNVSVWPTAGAITYGQTLASSVLSGGSATPAGSFAFTSPSSAPGAGTAAQGITYTPTDMANYNTASSTVSVTVNQAGSTAALVADLNPSWQGSNVTFTATLSPAAPATSIPTGTAQFYTNGVAFGSPVAISSGVASLTTANLAPGTNSVLAAYLGDSNFLGSSNSLSQVVRVVPGQPSTVSIQNNPDGTVTVTFAGTPQAQYLVQGSDSLTVPAWVNVSTNNAGTDGEWIFTESKTGHSLRFYRATTP